VLLACLYLSSHSDLVADLSHLFAVRSHNVSLVRVQHPLGIRLETVLSNLIERAFLVRKLPQNDVRRSKIMEKTSI